MEISLISNTGIQLYTVPGELVLETGNAIVRPLRFSEYSIGDVTYLDWVYYFPGVDKYVRRSDLEFGGYIRLRARLPMRRTSISLCLLPWIRRR